MSSNATEVLSARHGSSLLLTLNRPHAGNAIDPDTARALDRELDRCATEAGIRSVVLTGAGRFFCTGGDVKRYRRIADPAQLNEAFDAIRALLDRIEHLEQPVIAAIDGFAIGGGVELALACDLRIAAPSAEIGLPQARMGIVPGWNGIERLVRTVGRSTAMRILLAGTRYRAEEALALGLVDDVPAAGSALDAAMAFAAGLDQTSPSSVREIKRLVAASIDLPCGDARSMARDAFAALWFAADHREAQSASAEQRPPRFGGG
jgi:enoyl-CoA hydratase/carnithine racemase